MFFVMPGLYWSITIKMDRIFLMCFRFNTSHAKSGYKHECIGFNSFPSFSSLTQVYVRVILIAIGRGDLTCWWGTFWLAPQPSRFELPLLPLYVNVISLQLVQPSSSSIDPCIMPLTTAWQVALKAGELSPLSLTVTFSHFSSHFLVHFPTLVQQEKQFILLPLLQGLSRRPVKLRTKAWNSKRSVLLLSLKSLFSVFEKPHPFETSWVASEFQKSRLSF